MSAENDQNVGVGELPLRIGEWQIDPSCGRMTRNGKNVKLEPKVMDVLIYLSDRPGKVISREELEKAIWTGRVVTYDVLTGAIQKLRKAFEDDPRHPRIIETLSKKGYRFIAPVDRGAERGQSRLVMRENGSAKRNRNLTSLWILTVALIICAIAVLLLRPWQNSDGMFGEPTASVSIAVLPFDNLSEDPEQEYFADGMTDDLITELAKDPKLLVIARDSAFHYKGRARDIHQIAEELHVRYILSGSVRRIGEQLRLNTQLTDTKTGTHLWAQQYNGTLSNVFALQDRIESDIVVSLTTSIAVGQRPAKTPRVAVNSRAYDAFLLGRRSFFLYASRVDNRKARALYQKAIDLDPDFAMAYAMLSWTYAFEAMNGWTPSREGSLAKARAYAAKALELNNKLPVAYFVTGLVFREQRRYREALAQARKAIELDPSYANAHILLATLLYYTGQAQAGLELVKKAMKLNPHHPYNYPFHLGQAYFILGQYQQAIDAFEKGLESNPSSERLHVWLAAAYAQIGRKDDAKWEVEQVIIQNPEFSLERLKRAFPFENPADLDRFLSGLRIAGFAQ